MYNYTIMLSFNYIYIYCPLGHYVENRIYTSHATDHNCVYIGTPMRSPEEKSMFIVYIYINGLPTSIFTKLYQLYCNSTIILFVLLYNV